MSVTAEQLHGILTRYAESKGIQLNRDRNFTVDIIAGLLKNEERYGYRCCPCRLSAGSRESDEDIICPCRYRDDDIREFGSCFCGLYVSADWNEENVPHVIVPERRQQRRK